MIGFTIIKPDNSKVLFCFDVLDLEPKPPKEGVRIPEFFLS